MQNDKIFFRAKNDEKKSCVMGDLGAPADDASFLEKGEEADDLYDDIATKTLVECLRCSLVYEKTGKARYETFGKPVARKPCVKCGKKDQCIAWRGGFGVPSANATVAAFPFSAGIVYRHR